MKPSRTGRNADNFVSVVCRVLEHEHIHLVLDRLFNDEVSTKFDKVSWFLEILDLERVLDGSIEKNTLKFLKKYGLLKTINSKTKIW